MPESRHEQPPTVPSHDAGDDRPSAAHAARQHTAADGARVPDGSARQAVATAHAADHALPRADEERSSPAEATREHAERERRHAEARRGAAERDREGAEAERVTSERLREVAEAARRAAEEARDEVQALRGAFDEQLAVMREMRQTLLALEARLAGQSEAPGGT